MEIIKFAEETQTRRPICSYNYGCDSRMDAPQCTEYMLGDACWFINR